LLFLFWPGRYLSQMGAGPIWSLGGRWLASSFSSGSNLISLGLSNGTAVAFHSNAKTIANRQNIFIVQIEFL